MIGIWIRIMRGGRKKNVSTHGSLSLRSSARRDLGTRPPSARLIEQKQRRGGGGARGRVKETKRTNTMSTYVGGQMTGDNLHQKRRDALCGTTSREYIATKKSAVI